jgi:hypothetical protein
MKPYKSLVVAFGLLFLSSFISPSPTSARGKGGAHSSSGHSSKGHSSSSHSSGSHSSGKHSAGSYSVGKHSSGKHSSKSYSSASTGKRGAKKAQGVKRDSHGKIARSEKAKKQFMKQSGYPNGRPGYVVDHIVPLKRGGLDTSSNMQWQTKEAAKAKDKRE